MPPARWFECAGYRDHSETKPEPVDADEPAGRIPDRLFFRWVSYRVEMRRRDSRVRAAGIVLQINQEARVDARIELGAVTDTVEVTSAPPW